jgi:hypothetical protein
MPLTQRSRTALYQGLTQLIQDDQAVEEMLSYFPSRDVEEPVTKELMRAEIATVRTEIATVRAEMAEMRADLRTEIADLRTDMHAGFRRMTVAVYSSMIATAGVVIAANAAL